MWLERFWRDLHYALLSLRRAAVFTLVAIVSLSLGIGANFSAMDEILLRPLAVPQPDQPARVHSFERNCNGSRYSGRSGQIHRRRLCHGLSPLTEFSWNSPRRQGSATPRQTTARP
jgi:hypothetical protein